MDKLHVIEADGYYKIRFTNLSPEVVIDYRRWEINIKGISLMADPVGFYSQVFDFIKNVIKRKAPGHLRVSFHFFYINTQTIKQVVSFFSYLESLNARVNLVWYYSDEEIAELGSHLSELVNLPISLEYNSEDKKFFKV